MQSDSIAARLLAGLLALPLLLVCGALLSAWATPQPQVWSHLAEHVLGEVSGNTLLLLLGVGVGCSVLGIGLAWLSAHCEFRGRALLDWALVLPLAMPTYVVAFAWVGVLDYSAPLQSAWRALSGSRAALPFDGHGLPGAIAVLSLTLYPYVYVVVRAAFLRQGAAGFDAARSLGHRPLPAFLRAALPLVRPAWVAGLSLALLETLADFGAVSILGVDTFTTAIYKTWFGLFSLAGAAQLATLLLLAVLLVLALERVLRGRALRHESTLRTPPRLQLRGWRALLACGSGLVVVTLGFGVPLVQLLVWLRPADYQAGILLEAAINTLTLGLAVAAIVVAAAAMLTGLRYLRATDRWVAAADFAANLGYAIPGTVLAVAVMGLLVATDQWVLRQFGWHWTLAGSVLGVMLALLVRFLRIGHGAIEAGLTQLRPSLLESARLLGAGAWQRTRQVIWPQLRPSLLAAVLLVLVETMKEMPATLMLRPFGWDTLAVRIYAQTAEGLWAQAAAPGLLLVAVGLLPVWWLIRGQR